jgi:hypothetical protein
VHPIQAVVFVPHVDALAPFATTCIEHCVKRGYEVVGVVTGDWHAAMDMLFTETANVLVVARAEHIRQLEPRIEVVSQDLGPAPQQQRPGIRNAGPVRQVRRSHIIRPDAGA